jgi:transposase
MMNGRNSERQSKRQAVTGRDEAYAGLDVHKRTVAAAIRVNGAQVQVCSMPNDSRAVIATLAPYRKALRKVVYEAGPTGYVLARALQEAGFPVEVVAPSETARSSRRTGKSDRLDCRKLAGYAEGAAHGTRGLIKPVAIPTEKEQEDRQMVRLRDQLTNKVRRVKVQMKAFLLEYGYPEPQGLSCWSNQAIEELRTMPLPTRLRLYLDALLEELGTLDRLRKKVLAELKQLAKERKYAQAMRRAKTHPGVGDTVAITFLTEVYRPERFTAATQVAAYVGLAPQVSQSGDTTRSGPTIKAGRDAFRGMLVEASWVWIQYDPHARKLYDRLVRNTGSGKKAIVGVARHMVMNLWAMVTRDEDYRCAA